MATNFKWYHWLGGAATAVAFNGAGALLMGACYRSYNSKELQEAEAFRQRYGLPTEKQRLDLFRHMAPTWDKHMGAIERSSADTYRQEFFGHGAVTGDVLEVAIGTGRYFEWLRLSEKHRKQGEGIRSFVGIDCLHEYVDIARTKLPDLPFPAKVEVADAHRLPFPNDSFDTVMGSLCLCSLESPAEALKEMARVCRPGGQVLLVEPGLAPNWLVRWSQNYLGLVPRPKHAWESGWYDDINPVKLVNECPDLEMETAKWRAMGNWYLVKAVPRQE